MNLLFKKIYQASPQQVYRYFANKRRNSKAKDFIDKYIQTHSIRKLHVGSGGSYLDTWLNTDLITDNRRIVSLDVSKTFPIPSDSFDYIYSEHLFEHLTFPQQVNYLRQSYRILKAGGKIRTATPDFDFLVKLAGSSKSDFEREYLRWNFKTFIRDIPEQVVKEDDINVYVINNYFRDWGHQLIHNKSTLSDLLSYCGFHVLGTEEVGKSPDPVLAGLEQHGAMITEAYNGYETMIIEAIKRPDNPAIFNGADK